MISRTRGGGEGEIWGGGGVGRGGGGGGGREGGWEVTPVQTSRRVCVRTSHSPVSLPRSLSLPHTLSAHTHTHTHTHTHAHTRRGTGAKLGAYRRILGIVVGGGTSPPLLRVACLVPTPPRFPEPQSSPSASLGAAATAQPRPGDPKCEEGPLQSPAQGLGVGSRDASRPARTAG